jgi:hypothetical protein
MKIWRGDRSVKISRGCFQQSDQKSETRDKSKELAALGRKGENK